MTTDQATSFDRFSTTNATILAVIASGRGCTCQAYEDWFTYARWQAQGFQVQKGEKATKIATYSPITRKNDKGEEEIIGRMPRNSSVFCRHQVKSVN